LAPQRADRSGRLTNKGWIALAAVYNDHYVAEKTDRENNEKTSACFWMPSGFYFPCAE
jgi:hypothetical protein